MNDRLIGFLVLIAFCLALTFFILLGALYKKGLDLMKMKESIRKYGKVHSSEASWKKVFFNIDSMEAIFVRIPSTEKYLKHSEIRKAITEIKNYRKWIFILLIAAICCIPLSFFVGFISLLFQ